MQFKLRSFVCFGDLSPTRENATSPSCERVLQCLSSQVLAITSKAAEANEQCMTGTPVVGCSGG
jgi:hypothetical protein